jgi:hypothetical protein
MPFEKFFLCIRIVFILGCSHTSTTKIRKMFRIKETASGRSPLITKIIVMAKVQGVEAGLWHKPEHMWL